MAEIKNILGQRFGCLLVIEYAGTDKHRHAYWMCLCDCGNTKRILSNHLLRKDNPVKSCGNHKHRIKLDGDKAAISNLYTSYRHSAEERGYVFEITKEEFRNMTSSDCHYCSKHPNLVSYTRGRDNVYIYNGIDRVDNSLGYILSNCVPCCKVCNRAKSDMSYNEFLSWIEDIHANFINTPKTSI